MSISKRSALVVAMLACAAMTITAVPRPAHAAAGALVRNYQSGKCLEADARFLNFNGDRVQLWDCWGGNNQKWVPIPVNPNDSGVVWLQNAADGKCLDADANHINSNGDTVQLWDCNKFPHTENQEWKLYHVFGSQVDTQFRNVADGKVLEADANTVNDNGGRVQVWDSWGGYNQIWQDG